MFNDAAFRARHQLSAVNSINWARVMAQVVYYATTASLLGERRLTFAGSDRELRQRALRLDRPRDRGAHRSPDRRFQLQRHPHPLLRYPHDVDRGSRAHPQPEHGHPGVVQLRAVAVRDERAGRRPDRRAAAPAPRGRTPGRRGGPGGPLARTRLPCRTAGRRRDPGRHALGARRDRVAGDPHTAVGIGAARPRREPGAATVALATAHPAKFAEAVERASASGRRSPTSLADLLERPERTEQVPADLAAVQDVVDARCRWPAPSSSLRPATSGRYSATRSGSPSGAASPVTSPPSLWWFSVSRR